MADFSKWKTSISSQIAANHCNFNTGDYGGDAEQHQKRPRISSAGCGNVPALAKITRATRLNVCEPKGIRPSLTLAV